MRTRITIMAVTIALAASLGACSSSDSSSDKPTTAPSTPDMKAAEKSVGIPPKPTGAKRDALLKALKAVNPALVADEDKAVDNSRNQCSTISGGGNADLTAKGRFSNSGHDVTDTEAKAINAALKATLCP